MNALECPVCLAPFASGPIYLCAVGHSVCRKCSLQLIGCPICRSPFTSGRNYALEELLGLGKTCQNQGCGKIFNGVQALEGHRQVCRFRLVQCNLDQNHGLFAARQIAAHDDAKHAGYPFTNYQIFGDETYSYKQIPAFGCGNTWFLRSTGLYKGRKMIFTFMRGYYSNGDILVWCYGNDERETKMKMTYRILYEGNGGKMRSHKDACVPLDMSPREVMTWKKGLILTKSMIQTLTITHGLNIPLTLVSKA